jgi:hypothetical protein
LAPLFRPSMHRNQSPLTARDLVDMWAKYYGAKFSDDELDGILKYYQSPLGQKEVLASREAMTDYRQELQQLYDPVLKKATDDFIKRLQEIVVRCNCKKSATTKSGH